MRPRCRSARLPVAAFIITSLVFAACSTAAGPSAADGPTPPPIQTATAAAASTPNVSPPTPSPAPATLLPATPAPVTPAPSAPSGINAIAVGWTHACALAGAGEVRCWGYGEMGQLGNGALKDSSIPVTVTGLAGLHARALSAGFAHTCALTEAGGVRCWGWNNAELLGNGTTTDSPIPVEVAGLGSGVSAISAGSGHSCALTTRGGVTCWGANGAAELGTGSMTESSGPVPVPGLATGITSVSAGNQHTCAVRVGGGVVCWGYNESGQLGNGTSTDPSAPLDVVGLPGPAVAVSAGGGYSCALLSSGTVMCWGSNSEGTLGDQPTYGNLSLDPVPVAGLPRDVTAIAAGVRHACALTAPGVVWCWGSNSFGELGNVSPPFSSAPVIVDGMSGPVSAVGTGNWTTCALTGGLVNCWGHNHRGQLGNGTQADSSIPVTVALPAP